MFTAGCRSLRIHNTGVGQKKRASLIRRYPSASSSVISTFIKMCFFIFLTSKRFSVAFLNAFLYFMVIFTVWEQIRGGIKTLAAISQRETPVSGPEQRARSSDCVVLIKIIRRLYATAMLCLPAMKLQTF